MFNYRKLFLNISKNKYYRHKLYNNNIFELIIIKWDKNSNSPIHDHPSIGCLMYVIEGELTEKRYINNNIKKYILKNNSFSFIHNKMGKHLIFANIESYSLHLYFLPNYYK